MYKFCAFFNYPQRKFLACSHTSIFPKYKQIILCRPLKVFSVNQYYDNFWYVNLSELEDNLFTWICDKCVPCQCVTKNYPIVTPVQWAMGWNNIQTCWIFIYLVFCYLMYSVPGVLLYEYSATLFLFSCEATLWTAHVCVSLCLSLCLKVSFF